MVLKVEVIFVGKSDAIFHVGQAIDGIVEINVNKSKQFHNAYLKFDDSPNSNGLRTERNGRLNNQLFYEQLARLERYRIQGLRFLQTNALTGESKQYLLGASNSHQIHTLSPGLHRFPFQYTLPEDLPVGTHTLHVVIERPVRPNVMHDVLFEVVRLDEGLDEDGSASSLMESLSVQNEDSSSTANSSDLTRTFSCWPSKHGPLTLNVRIFQTIFIPGQAILVQGRVNNRSSAHVVKVIFELRRLIVRRHQQFTAKMVQKDMQTIARHEADGVDVHSDKDIRVRLPFPIQSFEGQQVAYFGYSVRMTAIIRILDNPCVDIPITMGTATADNPESIGVNDVPMTPDASDNKSLASFSIVDALPPSYDEATIRQENLLLEGEQLMAQWKS